MITETLTVYRGATDKMGNVNRPIHGTVQGVVAWGQGTGTGRYSDASGFKGEANNFTAQLFVPRGTDLANRDRIKRGNGDQYRIIGNAAWDQPHPMTGHDFGWTVFQMESM